MKEIIVKLLLLVSFSLTISCNKEIDASFAVDKDTVAIGEEITFTNTSLKEKRTEWDFGDGTRSKKNTVVKSYDIPGTYIVALENSRINNKHQKMIVAKTITVLPNSIDFEVDSSFTSGTSYNLTPIITGNFVWCNLYITEIGYNTTQTTKDPFNFIVAKKGWYTFQLIVGFANGEVKTLTKLFAARPGKGNLRHTSAMIEYNLTIKVTGLNYNKTVFFNISGGNQRSGAPCEEQAPIGFEDIPGGTYEVTKNGKVGKVEVDNNCIMI